MSILHQMNRCIILFIYVYVAAVAQCLYRFEIQYDALQCVTP